MKKYLATVKYSSGEILYYLITIKSNKTLINVMSGRIFNLRVFLGNKRIKDVSLFDMERRRYPNLKLASLNKAVIKFK